MKNNNYFATLLLVATMVMSTLLATNVLAEAVPDWFELEDADPATFGDWELRTDLDGYTGKGYLFWTLGNELSAPPANSIMEYDFEIKKAGTYLLDLRGQREHDVGICKDEANDQCNDIFTNIDEKEWRKDMMKGAWNEWIWDNTYSPSGTTIITNSHQLSVGWHKLSVGARSMGTNIDVIRIYEEGTTPPDGPGVVPDPIDVNAIEGSIRNINIRYKNQILEFGKVMDAVKVYDLLGHFITGTTEESSIFVQLNSGVHLIEIRHAGNRQLMKLLID